MIRLRRLTQVVSLLVFLLFLIITALPGDVLLPVVDMYPRMSPLMLFAVWLNTWRFPIAFLPAIIVLALTLLWGRFFCGWVCPLGVTLDATDRWLGPRRRDDAKERLPWKSVKYGVLILVLLAAYFEANAAAWLDPLSFATRLYALVLLPSAEFVTRLLLHGLHPVPGMGFVADNLYAFFRTGLFAVDQPQYHGMAAVFLIYLAVALLVYFNRRFWCRFLCPAGAILAIVAKRAFHRRVVDETLCTHCNKCVRNCRMGAIREGGAHGWRGECIECFTCKQICPTHAVSFRPHGRDADSEPVSLGRRGVVAALGGAAVTVPLMRIMPGSAQTSLIRPPGVAGEDLFNQTCLHCGACMRACPTNGLQPVWFEARLENLWTPHLVPRVGNCAFTCTKCGQICPSGAITLLPLAKKQRTVLGRAVFDHNRCIPWSRGENCAVCEEHCPVSSKAIRLREGEALNDTGAKVKVLLPYIVEEVCIGCGTCEKVCPVEGAAGVRVTGVKQHLLPAAIAAAAAAKKKKPNQGALADLLPADPAPFKPEDAPQVVGPDKLYDLIDGGADIYLEYGFLKALRQSYVDKNDRYLTVEIYLMKDDEAAFGIFSAERSPGEKTPAVGDNASANDYEFKFRQKNYYVKIYGDAKPAELETWGRAISSGIGGKGRSIDVLSWRPPETSSFGFKNIELDEKSALLIRGPLAMRRIFSFTEKDIYHFGDGTIAVSYTGKTDPNINSQFVFFKFSKREYIQEALSKLKTIFSSQGYTDYESYIKQAEIQLADSKGNKVLLEPAPPWLMVAVRGNAPE